MKIATLKVVRVASFALSVILFILGLLMQDLSILNYSVFLIWVCNICYAVERFYDRIFFFAFQVTFFTFLMGRTVAGVFLKREDYYHFSNEILLHTEVCLFIALISILFGYIFFTRVRFTKQKAVVEVDYNSSRYLIIRKISLYLYWAMLPFNMLIIAEKAIFVRIMGYANYYVDYTSRFPYFITKFGDICPLAFYIFLATMPNKKEIKWPTIIFFVRAVILMFTGKRADFVVPVLLLLLYFAKRNEINSGGEQWLSSKHLRMVAIAVPVVLVVLFSFNTSRFDASKKAESNSFFESILGFFDNTGFSVNVISFEKEYEERIPNKIYSFGDTTDYLRENVLTQLFFDFPVYRTQTAEKALYGNNFSQTVTYLRSPSYYLSGRGYGSSYIAEAYHDFGYFGIILWSFIYSYMFAKVYSFKGKGVIYVALALQALHYILLAPRNMASAFMSEYINVNTWIVIAAVLVLANVIRRRTRVGINYMGSVRNS